MYCPISKLGTKNICLMLFGLRSYESDEPRNNSPEQDDFDMINSAKHKSYL